MFLILLFYIKNKLGMGQMSHIFEFLKKNEKGKIIKLIFSHRDFTKS